MLLSFFKPNSGDGAFDHIVSRSISMLGDARHSFDLATLALLTNAGPEHVARDVRATDQRINETEIRIRSELVVHVSVQGGADIGSVLGYVLLIKKIERIGDQAKNIFDLATEGISLAGADDVDEFIRRRQEISHMYVEAGDLLQTQDQDVAREFLTRTSQLNDLCGQRIQEYLHSDQPGHWAVPRAMLYRYWKRIVANLAGITTVAIEPLQHIDYLEDGTVDIDD